MLAFALAAPLFVLDPPHKLQRSQARLEASLKAQLTADLRTAPVPATVEGAIRYAVDATGKALHVAPSHKTSMYFGTAERAGNCVEYAHLFAAVFDLTAHALGVQAMAFTVHSKRARPVAKKQPLRAWKDHDWTLVSDKTGKRWFVDAALADAGGPWDIAEDVGGDVPEPRAR
jgi:hypothetical protein